MKITLMSLADWKLIIAGDRKGTVYERTRGIYSVGYEFIQPSDDLIYVKHNKTDRTISFKILFRPVAHLDKWFCWTPTKSQARALGQMFWDLYEDVEAHNEKYRVSGA